MGSNVTGTSGWVRNANNMPLFYYDRTTGVSREISVDDLAGKRNEILQHQTNVVPGLAISPDGRYVLFGYSLGTNIWSVITHDHQTGINYVGAAPGADFFVPSTGTTVGSAYPELQARWSRASADQRYVAFETYAALLPEDTNHRMDVYLYDSVEKKLELISKKNDQEAGKCSWDDGSPSGWENGRPVDGGAMESPLCGNNVIDEGEYCDNGDGNSDTAFDACRTNCLPARCGDKVCDSNENSRSCPGDCPVYGQYEHPELCGNGVCDPGENYCPGVQMIRYGGRPYTLLVCNGCRQDCPGPAPM